MGVASTWHVIVGLLFQDRVQLGWVYLNVIADPESAVLLPYLERPSNLFHPQADTLLEQDVCNDRIRMMLIWVCGVWWETDWQWLTGKRECVETAFLISDGNTRRHTHTHTHTHASSQRDLESNMYMQKTYMCEHFDRRATRAQASGGQVEKTACVHTHTHISEGKAAWRSLEAPCDLGL